MEKKVEDSPVIIAGLQQHSSGSVTKKHTGRPVLKADDAAHHIGTHHEHPLVDSGLDELGAGDKGINES